MSNQPTNNPNFWFEAHIDGRVIRSGEVPPREPIFLVWFREKGNWKREWMECSRTFAARVNAEYRAQEYRDRHGFEAVVTEALPPEYTPPSDSAPSALKS